MAGYTFQRVVARGFSETFLNGINDEGEEVGNCVNPGGASHAFIDDNGSITTFSYGKATYAAAVDNDGVVYGSYKDRFGRYHGLIENNGKFASIDYHDATNTELTSTSNSGEMVGNYQSADGAWHGFTDINGVMNAVNVRRAKDTYVTGVNASGEIVGYYVNTNNKDHGFYEVDGVIKALNAPGWRPTEINGINDAGEMCGSFVGSPRGEHGFVYQNGNFTQVDDRDAPFAGDTFVQGINAAGRLVGFDETASGVDGFIGTPASGSAAARPAQASLLEALFSAALDDGPVDTASTSLRVGAHLEMLAAPSATRHA